MDDKTKNFQEDVTTLVGEMNSGRLKEHINGYTSPPDCKYVGEFLGPSGKWCLLDVKDEKTDLFPEYVERLRNLSTAGIVGDFIGNGGAASMGQLFKEIPRMKIKDDGGELELVLRGATTFVGSSDLSILSTEPQRAGIFLARYFSSSEFNTQYRT